MMSNRVLFIIAFVLFSVQVIAQPVLKIEGKVAGIMKGSVRLIDLEGAAVMESVMDRGQFVLEKPCAPGIYRLEIGKFVEEVFFNGGTVTVGGYIDPDSKEASQVCFGGLEENERLMKTHQEIAEKIRQQQKEVEKTGSQDEWIVKMGRENMDKAEMVIQVIGKEASPAWAASLAYLNRGTFYESAHVLYEALNDEGKVSVCGKLLKKYMESKQWLANGALAPDFTLQDADGKKVSLSELKGKVVVVDFWASWCGPCRAEMQYLKKIYQEYKGKNVEFVSVSLDDSLEKWKEAAAEEQIPWVSLWEQAGFSNSDLRKKYDFEQIPFVVVIDAEGKIAAKNVRRIALLQCLEKLL